MQKGDMGIPLCAHVHPKSDRMVFRQTKVIGLSLIHERESARRIGVPGVRRNHVEGGSQLWLNAARWLSSVLYVLLDVYNANHRNTRSRFGFFFDSWLHRFSKFIWEGNDHQGQRACHQSIGPASPTIIKSIHGIHSTTNLSRKPVSLWGQPPPPLKGHSTNGIRRQLWRPTHHCSTEDIQISRSVRTSFELTP